MQFCNQSLWPPLGGDAPAGAIPPARHPPRLTLPEKTRRRHGADFSSIRCFVTRAVVSVIDPAFTPAAARVGADDRGRILLTWLRSAKIVPRQQS